jgi:hypothetical protein
MAAATMDKEKFFSLAAALEAAMAVVTRVVT